MTSKRTKTRRKGEGSFRERAPGVWQILYPLPPHPDGRRRQGSETIRGNQTDALAALRKALSALDEGTHVAPTRETTAQFFADWLGTYAKVNTSEHTFLSYDGIVRQHIIPALGGTQLRSLSPEHILSMYAALRSPERMPRPLGEGTLLNIHRVLKQALSHAVKWRRLNWNPCAAVDAPRPQRPEMRTLDWEGVTRFLEAVEDSPYRHAYYVAVMTGLRRSELLALRWPAVDLDARAVSVTHGLHRLSGQGLKLLPPKTARSRRRVAIAEPVVNLLRAIKGQQIEHAELTLGTAWDAAGFVFARLDGSPHDPEVVTKDFTKCMRAVGLVGIRLHGLSHTHASLMLAAGENVKVVQERLGHASITVTSDIYGHVIPGMHRDAADRFAERLEGRS